MSFWVFIPARLASTRLPNKPLALIHGIPMVVHVAQRALASKAKQVVVAGDDPKIIAVCKQHCIQAILTHQDHLSGSDRIAQASQLLGVQDDEIIVNVQGDEPLIHPDLINDVAQLLTHHSDCAMGTVAHPIDTLEDFLNPNIVKVVLDHQSKALYFSRAPIPYWRDGWTTGSQKMDAGQPLRHLGIYSYRAKFLKAFPNMPPSQLEQSENLEQLRALSHGHKIAVWKTHLSPAPGVDTPEDLERVREMMTKSL
ncbi:MAG: 3-deoxy-manno-octulosonate cytidylyltransferase [Limnohabitans sp.]|nr:3-deoxy-manno-octulosonate cytidylyltransferase [Limnohabitans sp.]